MVFLLSFLEHPSAVHVTRHVGGVGADVNFTLGQIMRSTDASWAMQSASSRTPPTFTTAASWPATSQMYDYRPVQDFEPRPQNLDARR
eukprot:706635-Rhodomonas_salina.1